MIPPLKIALHSETAPARETARAGSLHKWELVDTMTGVTLPPRYFLNFTNKFHPRVAIKDEIIGCNLVIYG